MNAKPFVKLTLALLLSGLLLCAGLIATVDPFSHYHAPWFGLPVVYDNAYYQNPGLARHLDYDTAIMGTSMTQNFRASWGDELLGGKTVKLTLGGGTLVQFVEQMEIAFSTHTIRTLVFGYDVDMLVNEYGDERHDRPAYLWSDDLPGDAAYLWNLDALIAVVERLSAAQLSGEEAAAALDEAQTWDQDYPFSKAYVLEHHARAGVSKTQAPADVFLQAAADNTAALGKVIAAHPETTFDIFYPTYSILVFDTWNRGGVLDAMLAAMRQTSHELLAYDNVRLFNFFELTDVITDLDRYKDVGHYDAQVNRLMLECMADGRHQLTQENCDAQMDALAAFAKAYDYDAIFAGN